MNSGEPEFDITISQESCLSSNSHQQYSLCLLDVMAYTGTLKKFMDGKGFGFIENSDGSGDVFVHFSQLTNGGSEDMVVGAEMSFDIEEDARSGKTKATNVTLKDGGSGGGYGGYDSGKGKGKGKGKRYDPY